MNKLYARNFIDYKQSCETVYPKISKENAYKTIETFLNAKDDTKQRMKNIVFPFSISGIICLIGFMVIIHYYYEAYKLPYVPRNRRKKIVNPVVMSSYKLIAFSPVILFLNMLLFTALTLYMMLIYRDHLGMEIDTL